MFKKFLFLFDLKTKSVTERKFWKIEELQPLILFKMLPLRTELNKRECFLYEFNKNKLECFFKFLNILKLFKKR